jgi:protein gp37
VGKNSTIEWCDHTFNPWIGCQKVSEGCDLCYAERMNKLYKWNGGEWGPHAPRKRTSHGYWLQPLRWAKQAGDRRPRVFCSSLADWLDNQVPQEWRGDLAATIAATPELDWLLLTKRIENFNRLAPWPRHQVPENVWIGTTCENQQHFNRRWRYLSAISARIRFISYEPALSPLLLGEALPDWIICGGEDGASARVMDPLWARDLRNECASKGIAFFMKQMTSNKPIPADLFVREFPSAIRNAAGSRRKTQDISDTARALAKSSC